MPVVPDVPVLSVFSPVCSFESPAVDCCANGKPSAVLSLSLQAPNTYAATVDHRTASQEVCVKAEDIW